MSDEETVDVENSNIKCSKPKKTMKIKDFEWESKDMKNFLLSFTVGKSKTKLQKAVVKTSETLCSVLVL